MKKWKLIDFSRVDGQAVYKVLEDSIEDFRKHFDYAPMSRLDTIVDPTTYESYALLRVENEYYWSRGTIIVCETWDEVENVRSFFIQTQKYTDSTTRFRTDDRCMIIRDDLKNIYLANSSVLIKSDAKVVFYADWNASKKEITVFTSARNLGIL